jgi:hypothetical protein
MLTRNQVLCLLSVLLALALPGCLADDGACGANQEHNRNDNCVCKRGYRLNEHLVCVACKANETSIANRCECKQGYARAASGACVPSASLGDAAAPSGQGDPCQSAADCQGNAASYCETIRGHVCLVPDCQVDAGDCSRGWSCCDLTQLGAPTLCVPEGTCPVQ